MEQLDVATSVEHLVFEAQTEDIARKQRREAAPVRESPSYLADNQLELLKSGAYTPDGLATERIDLETRLEACHAVEPVSQGQIAEKLADLKKVSELINMALNIVDLAETSQKEQFARTVVSELRIDQNTLEFSLK